MAKGGKSSKRNSRGRGLGTDITDKLFEPQEVIDAIVKARGSVAGASRLLEVERQTVYNYCDEFPEVQKALEDSRKGYKAVCQELAKDNHLQQLYEGHAGATAYELEKMEPKADGLFLDLSKLTPDEIVTLHRLLQKAKPDGAADAAP